METDKNVHIPHNLSFKYVISDIHTCPLCMSLKSISIYLIYNHPGRIYNALSMSNIFTSILLSFLVTYYTCVDIVVMYTL